jgi:hypothetical protein
MSGTDPQSTIKVLPFFADKVAEIGRTSAAPIESCSNDLRDCGAHFGINCEILRKARILLAIGHSLRHFMCHIVFRKTYASSVRSMRCQHERAYLLAKGDRIQARGSPALAVVRMNWRPGSTARRRLTSCVSRSGLLL